MAWLNQWIARSLMH